MSIFSLFLYPPPRHDITSCFGTCLGPRDGFGRIWKCDFLSFLNFVFKTGKSSSLFWLYLIKKVFYRFNKNLKNLNITKKYFKIDTKRKSHILYFVLVAYSLGLVLMQKKRYLLNLILRNQKQFISSQQLYNKISYD